MDKWGRGVTRPHTGRCVRCWQFKKTYGTNRLEVCSLPKRVLQSLGFTVNRVLMKLFKSSNTAVVEQCRYFFRIKLPSIQLQRRFEKFLANAANDDDVILTLNDC